MAKLKVLARTDAAAAGIGKFYTGKRCRFGHLAERFVSSGNCVECDRRRATRNQQKYRAKKRKAGAA